MGDLQPKDYNKITGLAGKTPRYGKNEPYFDKPSKWLKRMLLREQDKCFSFGIWTFCTCVLNVYFHIVCTDVVYHLEKLMINKIDK